MDVAITREVSPALADCELTFLPRVPIDVARATGQHEAYCRRLASLGLDLVRLPADAALPDCCFVEDAAVVLDEIALITRPGAPSRVGELPAVAAALAPFRTVAALAEGRLDGGDVLVLGRRIAVGLSARSDAAGARALRVLVEPFGYEVTTIPVTACLHLKSAVTEVDEGTVLLNPEWVDPGLLDREVVTVDRAEPWAANVLRVGRTLLAADGFPRTNERLARRGYDVRTVDVSEFLKAEAGVTCKSLLLRR